MVAYLDRNLKNRSCIGLDYTQIDRSQTETFTKYKYYLYRYEPRRIDPNSWLDSDCVAILTFDKTRFQTDSDLLYHMDEGTGLYIIFNKERR
jgi:hypothetical protein